MNKAFLLSATAAVAILSGGAPVAAQASAHKPATVLYDQNSNFSYGIISDNCTSGFSSCADAAADDFVVPSGQTWHITEADVTGMYFNGSGPASSENVAFYADAKGKPGALLKALNNLSCTDNSGSFACKVGKNGPKLKGGTKGTRYWISVVANCSFSSGCGEWGWVTNSVVHGKGAVWSQGGQVKRIKPLTDLTFTLIGSP